MVAGTCFLAGPLQEHPTPIKGAKATYIPVRDREVPSDEEQTASISRSAYPSARRKGFGPAPFNTRIRRLWKGHFSPSTAFSAPI
ncbi:hypothetical protein GW17_00004352 [Ensete ventricosum]|uniref:Uncharacterized protein n=1 Tax=Ensete ventricosum TaxID=4639 RepID=A0A427AC21_ENSVE|nr:hypothetical protein B296_00013527 [Ensete ventricosum]RWW31043.1 hypothetical protein GW17_00004352 [Ensete ventricosum]RZR94410.1 hypothetical protein BHM03_00023095 [Ensete ventricosum]